MEKGVVGGMDGWMDIFKRCVHVLSTRGCVYTSVPTLAAMR